MPRYKPSHRNTHDTLDDTGRVPHAELDAIIAQLRAAPITITGERDDPETALANLLTALAQLGLIIDSTTAT